MLKSYFLLAWRNLLKQRKLSFISVFGLSLGIACFSLFMLYAINEFNFNGFYKNARNLYLIHTGADSTKGKEAPVFGSVQAPLAPAMKRDLPGVADVARVIESYNVFLKINNQAVPEKIAFADPSFLKMFSTKLKQGDRATALQDPHSIIVTEQMAKKLFGTTDAIGKILQIKVDQQFEPFTVTGIEENPPSNASFQFRMLASFDFYASFTTEGKMSVPAWSWFSAETFVQLRPGVDLPEFEKQLFSLRKKYFPQGLGSDLPPYELESLLKIHTDPRLKGLQTPSVDPKFIWMLLTIAGTVLLIACINFTTLAIGRSAHRTREVGVRKVMGGSKKSLVMQFLTESFFLAAISGILGFLLANLLLPSFNHLSGRTLHFSLSQFPQLAGLSLGLVLLVSIFSGFYPALILSGFNAVDVLKATIKFGGSNFITRSLVTFQFVLSAGLIISAIIIMQQLHFMQSKNPGFDKENVVFVNAMGVPDTRTLFARFKNELADHPEIVSVANSDAGLGKGEARNETTIMHDNKEVFLEQYFIDPGYLATLGMHLVAGRNFNPSIPTDTVNAVIINESTLRLLGWTPENAIGRRFKDYNNMGVQSPVIIGVVADFNFNALNQQVTPQIFHEFPQIPQMGTPDYFYVRLSPGDPSKALAAMQAAWKKFAPEYNLRYTFLDEDLNRYYESESRLSNIFGWAGGISIFLACLGLLGLTSLAVVNRTKEIGIRKVLGASVSTLVGLLSKDFIRLVAIAFVIVVPVVGYLMHKWLQDYAYRIHIEWWVFAVTGVSIIVIAFLTVSLQVIKAALANPVNSLRTE
ncbi:MAG: ABC transporter permease [Puia sp.]|nr:ABC transporter permease [Puia sp.]